MRTAFLLFASLFLLAGCTVFDPREAAAPSGASARDFSQYQDVLDQIRDIYTSGRSADMANLLDDNGFIFEGDTLDSLALHPLFRTWDKATETQVTIKILSDSLERIANFSVSSNTLFSSADSNTVEWTYDLTRRDNTHIRGISEFSLRRNLSRYYLVRWRDRHDPSAGQAITWGRWKMEHL
jgi:hypothetical protein